jgi:hypothetical protein
MLTELNIAKNISTGKTNSPVFCDVSNGIINFSNKPTKNTQYALLDLRIYGTGLAKRGEQFVYKPPREHLTENAKALACGLTVIYESQHPKTGVNNETNNIGSIFYPYIKNNELWGVAKITDLISLAEIVDLYLQGNLCSTSSGVYSVDKELNIEGENISYEKLLQSMNHVLITPDYLGTWNKGNPNNNGINLSTYRNNKMGKIVENPDKEPENTDDDSIIENLTKGLSATASTVAKLEEGQAKLEAWQIEILKALQALAPQKTEPTATPPAPETKPPEVNNDAAAAQTAKVETPAQQTAENEKIAELENRIQALEGEEQVTENDLNEKAEMQNDCDMLSGELANRGIRAKFGSNAIKSKDYALSVLKQIEGLDLTTPLLSDKELAAARDDTSSVKTAMAYIKTAVERAGRVKPKINLMPRVIKVTKKPINALTTEINYSMDNPALLISFLKEPAKVQQIDTSSF